MDEQIRFIQQTRRAAGEKEFQPGDRVMIRRHGFCEGRAVIVERFGKLYAEFRLSEEVTRGIPGLKSFCPHPYSTEAFSGEGKIGRATFINWTLVEGKIGRATFINWTLVL